MHLLMNLLVLYFFGTMVEPRLGRGGVLRLYLVGGAAGALLHQCIASLQAGGDVPLVGASGACYAFLLYAACLTPRSTVFFLFVPVPLWGLAAFLVGLGVYSTFVEFATGFQGGVSHGAHLGGALLGLLAHRGGWFVDHRAGAGEAGFYAGIAARWREAKRQRREDAAAARQLRLDEILDKVKQQGIAALTAAERRFLERMSARPRSGRS